MLCAGPLYVPVQSQWSLTFLRLLSLAYFFMVFLYEFNILLDLDVIPVLLFVNRNIFPISKSVVYFSCFLKGLQNFLIQSFLQYKSCLFSLWSNAQLAVVEYSQGICFAVFDVEEFSKLYMKFYLISCID